MKHFTKEYYTCDVCGKVINGKPFNRIKHIQETEKFDFMSADPIEYEPINYDLCDDCYCDLKELLSEKVKERTK